MTKEPMRDIVYVEHEGRPLKLDLFLPEDSELPCPVVVWVCGGGWQGGGKDLFPDHWFVESGIAVAAIDYRLSAVRAFPAAIEDVQTAVCWLRAHAKQYRIDPNRMGAWGSSAGGHLTALLGTSAGVKNWSVPKQLADQSREVQAVCDVNGPSLLSRMAEPELKKAYARLYQVVSSFLGGPIEDRMTLAKEASPLTHVHRGCPPFLIFHGTADTVVPFDEGVLLHKALEKAGVDVEFHAMQGEGHGYTMPAIMAMNRKTLEFFVRVLKPASGGARCASLHSWQE
ncbi:MAG: alpha/beta hydrolase [Kiritimatiellia bacterium]|jgi:acetyl esterase/lipase